MKTTMVIILFCLAATFLAAQDTTPGKLRVGVYANAGTSSWVMLPFLRLTENEPWCSR